MQRDPHPDQPTGLADLGRRDPRLGQQVRPQQVGEGPGVDGVVLDPSRGDRAVVLRFALAIGGVCVDHTATVGTVAVWFYGRVDDFKPGSE